MGGDATANAVLWLEPNADPVTIEAAYERLIKGHHPIETAAMLRGRLRSSALIARSVPSGTSRTRSLNEDWPVQAGESRAWTVIALLLVIGVGLLVITQPSLSKAGGPRHTADRTRGAPGVGDPMAMWHRPSA